MILPFNRMAMSCLPALLKDVSGKVSVLENVLTVYIVPMESLAVSAGK